MFPFEFLALLLLCTLCKAAPRALTPSSRCIGTISSLDDVDNAVQCTTVNINPFTVPGGKTFSLDFLAGTTVNVLGDIQFGNKSWEGPLLEVKGTDITFNGNGHILDGGGPFYWKHHEILGIFNRKPSPMMRFEISGTVSNINIVNSPAKCFATYAYNGPLLITSVNVNNGQGNGIAKNTDGFDITGNDIIVQNSAVVGQDVCVTIARGQNITFQDNHCEGGYGISIGSIDSKTVVEDIMIRGNTIVDSQQGFSIRTDGNIPLSEQTNSQVANVTYSDNTATNCLSYGLLITQGWPEIWGKPDGVTTISGINFNQGTTDVAVASGATMVGVNCASSSCTGPWDWSGLKMSGGKMGPLTNIPTITGFFGG